MGSSRPTSEERLPNYLRAYRKRLGLSQKEIAYLLGCRGGGKVSRYERFVRDPSFETALACEVIFQTPSRDLFAGVHERVERAVSKRAKRLAQLLAKRQRDPQLARKLRALQVVIDSESDEFEYEPIERR